MNHSKNRVFPKLIVLVTFFLGLTPMVVGQIRNSKQESIEFKLSQKTTFVPQSESALEQLIEIAQRYQIPMGIEWIDRSGEHVSTHPYKGSMTVRNLINLILQQSHGYQARVKNGVLHIAQPVTAAASKNFLNLRISNFQVDRANMADANALLRLKIKMTLHPERYVNGVGGGYGYGVDGEDGFDISNITFSGQYLTIREILNEIATANGNSLWVVRLIPPKMMTDEPFFAQGTFNDGGQAASDFHWQFIPLKKVKDNKEE